LGSLRDIQRGKQKTEGRNINCRLRISDCGILGRKKAERKGWERLSAAINAIKISRQNVIASPMLKSISLKTPRLNIYGFNRAGEINESTKLKRKLEAGMLGNLQAETLEDVCYY
jgi:hypothetical protein